MLRIVVASLVSSLAALIVHAQNFTEVKPSPQQVEWQDLEFGVLIHFGTNTFLESRVG